jgi:hypothetical protein
VKHSWRTGQKEIRSFSFLLTTHGIPPSEEIARDDGYLWPAISAAILLVPSTALTPVRMSLGDFPASLSKRNV